MVGINTNVSALNARQSLDTNAVNQSQAMQQLSTGLRINSAKDDAAGLAIATKMNANIKGVAVAVRNANDGISMAQTAESSLGSVTNMLQRMRELAVQASNGTLTSANRASMQLEVKQLSSEIDNIGKTANFNGIKLFDGSASAVKLQTNINAGDVVSMAISSMNSNTIGTGNRSSLTGYASSSALSSGDLVINGVTIGSSLSTDDNASSASQSSSAISKAAAINRQSSLTGVVATVNSTTASGASQTAASVAGAFTINGIATASITTSATDSGYNRTLAVTEINKISKQTGVIAIDTGSTSTGVQLVAADGRNITVAYGGTMTSAASGVGAAGTSYGTYSLNSTTGSPITVASSTGNNTNGGLLTGTYKANTSLIASSVRAVATTSTATTSLSSGDLVLNGIAIGASSSLDDLSSDTTATGSVKSASSIAIAAAVNKSSAQTGVTAVANANTLVGSSFTATSGTDGFIVNGVSIAITTSATSTRQTVVDAVNQYSGRTGVVASDNGNGLTLSAADGRNISLAISGSALTAASLGISAGSVSAAATAGAATVTYGTISLISDKQITVSGGAGSTSLANLSALGIKEGVYGGSNNGVKVSSIDISTIGGATDALTSLDAALGQISDQRSNLGAIQNRLQSAVDNLTSSSTNLQAAQGRIQDTDYSATTTQMSKSQIISQAATAMLAQANQQPQMVLSLLK